MNAALRKRPPAGVKKIRTGEQTARLAKLRSAPELLPCDFENSKTYVELARRLARLEKDWNAKATHIFHLAVPPSLFGEIPENARQGWPRK